MAIFIRKHLVSSSVTTVVTTVIISTVVITAFGIRISGTGNNCSFNARVTEGPGTMF
jgi:hypothetical protein